MRHCLINIVFLFSNLVVFLPDFVHAQVAVIVNKTVPVQTLEIDKILDVFTLNTQNWSNGLRITVIDFKGIHTIKNKFYTLVSTSPQEIQKIWLKKQFSGKAMPPLTLPTEQDILEKVSATPGAIGYISADKVTKEVKVIALLK